ncbi:hypothetical protein KHA90_21580 [Flavobacterium psychroterrae]|uniref:Trimeric autotransporter adhesin YadA-like head domain-containing protein n=1 Tax=Flavobacterium psychroterrae TaxID=2133767 RepID=A0ABS5PH14_9FLAO|nr:hypothetical protein [Flavobacterium psychroterrae]MBS7233609.1 hypothetical protein [Flavobacterium psychroterrae]
MAIQTLDTIKQWFKTGLKPTQTQFWDTWDSFRHKDVKVPVQDVENLSELLLTKPDKDDFKTINGQPILGSGNLVISNQTSTLNEILASGNDGFDKTISLWNGQDQVTGMAGGSANYSSISFQKTGGMSFNEVYFQDYNSRSQLNFGINGDYTGRIGITNLDAVEGEYSYFSKDTAINLKLGDNKVNYTFNSINRPAGTYEVATLSDLSEGTPASKTQSGIVDNTSLQELGGADKLINGVRIGQGEGTGISNTAFGVNVLSANTSGSSNTGIGFGVLETNTTGESNTGLGDFALNANTTGSYNDAFGGNALSNNTSGYANTAVGGYALTKNQTSQYNVAIGCNSLSTMISGLGQSTAIGAYCMSDATSTDKNAAIGTFALRYNTAGFSNTAVGHTALGLNTSGNSNNAFGNYSLGAITTGAANIGIGKAAGRYVTTGNSNIYIGSEGVVSDAQASGIINIGNKFIAKESKISLVGRLNLGTAPVYEGNSAALAGGLIAGDVYRTSTGILMITY